MNIELKFKTYSEIENAELFEYNKQVYLKIEEIKDTKLLGNAVNMENGKLVIFSDKAEVNELKNAKIIV